jgi:ParB family transcriptional regulator, chromosome partitioning protein
MRSSPERDTMEVVEMEIAHLELRYAHTRIIKRESLLALAASIDQWGQMLPVIAVEPRVLIDGYRRVAALKLCKRDTVVVELWRCREDQALLRVLASGSERRWDVVEQAALIRELMDCHRISQARVARSLGRNPSWVARRLSLLDVLPEEILQKVRSGCLSSWAASRVLAPLARANTDHAAALGRWITHEHVSTRDLADFFAHYQSAAAITRERMAADPSLFMKALRVREQKKAAGKLRAGPEGKWISDLLEAAATVRRLSLSQAPVLSLAHQSLALRAIGELARFIQVLDSEIGRCHDSKGLERCRSNPPPEGNGHPPDQPRPQGVEEHRPEDPAGQG